MEVEVNNPIKIYKEAFKNKFSLTPNAKDCAGFIKTVARDLDIFLPNRNTEGLIKFMDRNWIKYDNYIAACDAAEQGNFVVVAANGSDLESNEGHIAIILSEKDRQNSHFLMGASLNEIMRSRGDKTLAYVFRKRFQNLLKYRSPKRSILYKLKTKLIFAWYY